MQTLEHEPDARPSAGTAFAVPVLLFGLLGIVALIVALVAVAPGDTKSSTATASSAPVKVTLSDFKIDPGSGSAVSGAGLDVTNAGRVEHNLAVVGTKLATPMLAAGKSAHLDLSTLPSGDYTIICEVPGHKDAGMASKLRVAQGSAASPAAAGSATATSAPMTPEQMDAAMKASIAAFPAATAGLGGQVLAPTVLADGTKQFELTAALSKWEVSPGKTVDAMTYNGTVPGPTMKVAPGDKVRVILHNRLPESTSIHVHGIDLPNAMDGTTDVTQDPVLKGADFTYELTAQSTPAVGMYHSHHNAVKQVPDGLAGAFLVGQEPVPAGVTVSQEQVMILDDSGAIGYAINGKSFPATAPISAALGDWVEVHYMNEGTQIHPMHLHGMGQLVIAKDGYPLATPQMQDTVLVAPGERYTVLVHATSPGTWV